MEELLVAAAGPEWHLSKDKVKVLQIQSQHHDMTEIHVMFTGMLNYVPTKHKAL